VWAKSVSAPPGGVCLIPVSRFSPSSYPQLFSRIHNGKLGPLTALNDAIGRYVETTRGRGGQHILLLYTDGGDSANGMTAADVQTLLRMGDVMVYVMGYVEKTGSDRTVPPIRSPTACVPSCWNRLMIPFFAW